MIEIKRWGTGEVIHSGEFESIKECLEDGVRNGIDFYRAHLNNAQLDDAELNNAHLNNARLNGAYLNCAELNNAHLNGAHLNGAHLSGAKLNGAQLNGAQLNGVELNYSNLNGANLNDAQLNYSNLNYAQLNNAELNNARLNYATGSVHGDVYCLQHGLYKLVAHSGILHGGCTTLTLEEWLEYNGDDLDEEDKSYLENITKPFAKMIINLRKSK